MDISKIKLPSEEEYSLKDAQLRKEIEKLLGPGYFEDEEDQK